MTNKIFLLLMVLSSCVFAQQDDGQQAPVDESNDDLKKQVKCKEKK